MNGGGWGVRTRGKALLKLLGLVGVLEDECVDVPGASDLELDVVDLLVLLYAGGCNTVSSILSIVPDAFFIQSPSSYRVGFLIATMPRLAALLPQTRVVNVHLASLRLQISMNCLISETSEGILTD